MHLSCKTHLFGWQMTTWTSMYELAVNGIS